MLAFHWFKGLRRFDRILAVQQHLCELKAKADSGVEDVLLLLEHQPTFTDGIRNLKKNDRKLHSILRQTGAEFHQIRRGGKITFHGPGQLVGYPIMDLRQNMVNI